MPRLARLTPLLALAAAFAVACSSGGGTPSTTATAEVTRTPLPTATVDVRRAERTAALASLRDVPAVAEVIAAIEEPDPSTLAAMMFRHGGYCESPVPVRPPIVPSHSASSACFGSATSYQGFRVEGSTVEGFGGLWQPVAAESLLTQLLRAENEWHFAGVTIERYQRAAPEGLEARTRHLVRFELVRTAVLQLPEGEGMARQLTFTIDTADEAEPHPRPINELRVDRESTDAAVVAETDLRTPAPAGDVTSTVRARLEETPELAAVLPALTDLEALIGLVQTQESSCIHPPLPGKEIPEICEEIGNPPGGRYTSAALDFSVLFPVSVERLQVMLGPLYAVAPPILGAWHLDASADGGSERYLIALGGPLLSASGRDESFVVALPWNGIMLSIDPLTEPPIEYITLLGPDRGADDQARLAGTGLTDLARR